MANINSGFQYENDIGLPEYNFVDYQQPYGIGSKRRSKRESIGSLPSIYPVVGESAESEIPFTVENKDDHSMINWVKQLSITLCAIKVMVAVLVTVVTLFCVVASKLSILSISKRLNKDGTNSTHRFTCKDATDLSKCERETSFMMLCLVLMIPPAYTFVKMVIITCNKITHPWPTKLAIVWVSFLYTALL